MGELAYTFSGLSGKTKEDFGHGEAKYVTYKNVFGNALVEESQLEQVQVQQNEGQTEIDFGDVLFTTSSETPSEVGMSSVVDFVPVRTYLNSFCFGVRFKNKSSNNYNAALFRSASSRAKIALLAQGISRYNISKTALMQLKFEFPEHAEQEGIGSLLATLDSTLTLQQGK